MSFLENRIWVEKYRPSKIADCILPKTIAKEFQSFIDNKKIPNLMLCGPAGTGKTTAAVALCKELDYEYIMINGSNEGRLIDTVRTKITQFGSSMSIEGKRKCIIVDEAEGMPNDPQMALRNLIEELSDNCSFILTCNFPNRIIPAIHSRCAVVDYTIPAKEREAMILGLFKRVRTILDAEGVTYDVKALGAMVAKYFPDMRRLLNELQRRGTVGAIDATVLEDASNGDMDTLISYLKDKNFRETRKWVATTPNLELSAICREMYNRLYDICIPDDMPQLILLMGEYQYKDAFVSDKEINCMAFLTEVMSSVQFK